MAGTVQEQLRLYGLWRQEDDQDMELRGKDPNEVFPIPA